MSLFIPNSSWNSSTPIEWNSNAFIIQRFNEGILKELILSKREKNLARSLDVLRDFYLEICADLNKDEHDVWEDIKKLRIINGNISVEGTKGYVFSEGYIWAVIDEIERRLRLLAKKHGYLASNKEDPRRAITQR